MAATWITPAGSLGLIPELQYYNLNLQTYSPGSSVTYTLISGTLPAGLSLASDGNISGNTLNVTGTITSNFTVRATDTIGAVADRSFNLTVASVVQPEITPNTGAIAFTIAGDYYQQTFTLVDTTNLADTNFIILAGNVAPNLTLYANGNLFGYVEPVTGNTNFGFDVRATDGTKFDNNYMTQWVLDRKSMTADTTYYSTDNVSIITADTSNLYTPFLVTPAGLIGNVRQGNKFNTQILAEDYDNDYLNYELVTGSLPPGLTLVANTGWITGDVPLGNAATVTYTFDVRAMKRFNTDFVTDTRQYSIQVIGQVDETIDWVTASNLGTIYNGEISELYVEAVLSSGSQLQYSLVGNGIGGLPIGLDLLPDGVIAGRVSFEMSANVETYTFTVRAKDVNGLIFADRQFTVQVLQRNLRPYENLYVQLLPSRAGRFIYNELITNTDIIPPDYVYRYWDQWFSKNTLRRMLFLTGLNPDTDAQYINAMTLNHYWKTLGFGEVKTAVAKDDNFNTVYEVVYIDIIDQQVNASGVGPNIAESVPTNSQNISTVYPNSFPNMIQRLAGNNTSTTTDYTFYTDPNLAIPNPNSNTVSSYDEFGSATSFYDQYVAVGAPNEDNDIEGNQSGNVYIFNATTGTLIANVGNNNGSAVSGELGYSVSLDSNVMVAGAWSDTGGGSITIFKTASGNWSDITRFTKISNPGSSSARFGWSVSVDGKYILVGAPYDSQSGASSGRAYVYDIDGNLVHTLYNPFTTPASDVFGISVASYGQWGVVGAQVANGIGAVAIYNLVTGGLVTTIDNPDFRIGTGDVFGCAVDISQNYLIVGARGEDEPDPYYSSSGVAYVYRSTSGTWKDAELLYVLRNPAYGGNPEFDAFGWSVAINNKYAVVGAYATSYPQTLSGVTYVFDLRNGLLAQTFPDPRNIANHYFGYSVDINQNNDIVAGVWNTSTTVTGNVYIFNPDSSTTSVDNSVGYQDRGILPRWMTSRQPDGTVLGFTRALVLCYTNPGRSAEVAYRIRNAYQDFNLIDFTIDRYEWDNVLSNNYIKSDEAIAGTGYLIANTQSNIVTGNSTIFSGELAANATLYVGGVIIGNVVTITDNTTLVMDANSYSNVSNISFTYSNIFLVNNYVTVTGNISANTTSNVVTGVLANVTGTGTITGNTASTTITGNATTFTAEAKVGKNIYVSGNSIGIIRSIISANVLTVFSPLASNISSASFEIEGTSTAFTSELHIGDAVVVNTNVVLGYVSSISSDTSMNLTANSTANVNNLSYSHTYRDPYTTPSLGDKYLKYPQVGVLS